MKVRHGESTRETDRRNRARCRKHELTTHCFKAISLACDLLAKKRGLTFEGFNAYDGFSR